MSTTHFSFWEPGSEERCIRVFVSHRYGQDRGLYDAVFSALARNAIAVQDTSLSSEQAMQGPRGGALPKMEIQMEIAARIYTSDVVIAPSRVGAGRSEWVTWEVQLASVGYGIPILFVNQADQKRSTRLVRQIKKLGLRHEVSEPNSQSIVRNLTALVDGHPNWSFRGAESDRSIRYRGPPEPARTTVLKKLPYTPRLGAIGPAKTPRKRPLLWPFRSRPEGKPL